MQMKITCYFSYDAAGVKELSAPKYQYQQNKWGRACKAYIVCNVHNQSQ